MDRETAFPPHMFKLTSYDLFQLDNFSETSPKKVESPHPSESNCIFMGLNEIHIHLGNV